MQRVLIVSGVLGLGSALVFAAAAVTAVLFPNGTMVAGGWNGSMFVEKGVGIGGMPIPMTAPVVIDEGKDLEVPAVEFDPEPTPEPAPTD
jgi:hypothetical protein